MMEIARVAIVSRQADLETPMDYILPSGSDALPGHRVQVPLGPRLVEGIIIEIINQSPVKELKPIRCVIDQTVFLTPELIKLARWLRIRACCSLSQAIAAMMPPRGSGQLPIRWQLNPQWVQDGGLPEKQQLIVDYMSTKPPLTKAEIVRALKISQAPMSGLVKKNIVVSVRPPAPIKPWNLTPVTELTAEQKFVLEKIREQTGDYDQHQHFLLHGITGSGKTEVYLRLARDILAKGRQILILVPEIALTTQLVARFNAAFGRTVAVLHSGLTNNARIEHWQKIASGTRQIVIGTRSAVFAPFSNLGLVVVDEEHEPAYKQEESPRYHARDVVLWRANYHRAIVVLGTATPALESYKRAQEGKYILLQMEKRIVPSTDLKIELVDMRTELAGGNRTMFSRVLTGLLDVALSRGEQAILFLNRRGVAPTVLCRSCGYRCLCPDCALTLTLHRQEILSCHYCGHTARRPQSCPECGSVYLRELGLGTQKLEAELTHLFPGHNILRLDRDSAGSFREREASLLAFYQQKASLLVGTQMVAKGLDFPNVSVVGIVLADLSLAVADFRAAERTFQLVSQAGGRSGRGKTSGHVVIQSYQPEHYCLGYALKNDYVGFARHELSLRALAALPPYAALSRIIVSCQEISDLAGQVRVVADALPASVEVLYSGLPPIEKIKGWHRWQIVLKHNGSEEVYAQLNNVRTGLTRRKNSRFIFDNDPYNFM